VTDVANDTGAKPATAARIYDFQIGGTHNYPADRAAAAALAQLYPSAPAAARAIRAWLGRAVRYAAEEGIRQFLDIGSGIPTENNVHQVVEPIRPDARVVYVDIDPVAVAEGLEILEGSDRYTSVWGDLADPDQVLVNPQVRALIDFGQPVALILSAVLHFVPDERAYGAAEKLVAALVPGSMLAIAHASIDEIESNLDAGDVESGKDVYRRRTATPVSVRTRAQIERFFGGHPLVEPGLVYLPEWRPDPAHPSEFMENPAASAVLGAVARIN
jgi:O-methyltransferase involved in polyketide biosynthesis